MPKKTIIENQLIVKSGRFLGVAKKRMIVKKSLSMSKQKPKLKFVFQYQVLKTNGSGWKVKRGQKTGASINCIPKRIRECVSFKMISITENESEVKK